MFLIIFLSRIVTWYQAAASLPPLLLLVCFHSNILKTTILCIQAFKLTCFQGAGRWVWPFVFGTEVVQEVDTHRQGP